MKTVPFYTLGGVVGVTPWKRLANQYEMLRQSAKSFLGSFKSVINEPSRQTKLAPTPSRNPLGMALHENQEIVHFALCNNFKKGLIKVIFDSVS